MLTDLIADATVLGGGDLCAAGHDWRFEGGRYCERCDGLASQPVYRCARCGEWDYGEAGGPGHAHCAREIPCCERSYS